MLSDISYNIEKMLNSKLFLTIHSGQKVIRNLLNIHQNFFLKHLHGLTNCLTVLLKYSLMQPTSF